MYVVVVVVVECLKKNCRAGLSGLSAARLTGRFDTVLIKVMLRLGPMVFPTTRLAACYY